MISISLWNKPFGSIIDFLERGALGAPFAMNNSPASLEENLSQEEWQELFSLKEAIDGYPASIATATMERFTELFVRSLHGKGDTIR